jgi:cytochrome b
MHESANTRRVWDLPVRIVHWLLVFGIAGSYATHKAGVAYFRYHLWFGYLVVVLVAFRIVWGFVGTRHARFRSFLQGPRKTLAYLRGLPHGQTHVHAGHNPLGAWMVVFLLLALLAQGITGLFSNDEIFNTGPLYGYIGDAFSLKLTSWHRRLFDWILVAVALHVLAVLAHRLIKKDDLVGPMFSGRKPASAVAEHQAISSSRLWIAALVLAALVAILTWFVTHAPGGTVAGFE